MPVLRGRTPIPETGQKRTRIAATRFTATFYNHEGGIIHTKERTDPRHATGMGEDIIRANISKSLHSPLGTWSMVLVPRQMYLDRVSPGDWCEIKSDYGDGKGQRIVMYGPVKSVRRIRTIDAKGGRQTLIHVGGADFGLALANTVAIYDAALANSSGLVALGFAPIVNKLKSATESPGAIVRSLIDHYLLNSAGTDRANQWVDPKTREIFGKKTGTLNLDYIDEYEVNASSPHAVIAHGFNLSSSLWQLMEQWSNQPINELFCDLRPPKNDMENVVDLTPAVVLRRNPFWGKAWDDLTTCIVDVDEVDQEDLGKSDEEVYNWIRVQDECYGQPGGMSLYLPSTDVGPDGLGKGIGTVNINSVKRFGFRRMEPPSQFIMADFHAPLATPKSIPNIIEYYTGLLSQWHHSNEGLLSGSLSTYYRPDIRIGYKLAYIDWTNRQHYEFYVEGISHSLVFPGKSTTSIMLTRGRDPNDSIYTADLQALMDAGILTEIDGTLTRIARELASL